MKNSTAPAVESNPQVLIKYSPEQALVVLGNEAQTTLGKLQGVKAITNTKSLEIASEIMDEGNDRAAQLETFRVSLVDSVQKAATRFREIPGFGDFEVTLTIKKWGLRTLIANGIENIRRARSSFLAAEQEKQRQAQLKAEADQRAINEKAAKAAAEAARKAGADKAAQMAIKADVMATPAPIVASKALDTAKAAGATVRYDYYASLTDVRAFLIAVGQNEVLMATFDGDAKLRAAIETAFRPMARAQKEYFKLPGMTWGRNAVDVSR